MAPGDPLIRWDWVLGHLDDIAFRLGEHVLLTGVAVGVGFIISFALALLALLIPFTGLSFLTAEIALVSYTILILVRNIVAGVAGVPAEMREAAAGVGYTSSRGPWRR